MLSGWGSASEYESCAGLSPSNLEKLIAPDHPNGSLLFFCDFVLPPTHCLCVCLQTCRLQGLTLASSQTERTTESTDHIYPNCTATVSSKGGAAHFYSTILTWALLLLVSGGAHASRLNGSHFWQINLNDSCCTLPFNRGLTQIWPVWPEAQNAELFIETRSHQFLRWRISEGGVSFRTKPAGQSHGPEE